jgi:hypothetical protein
MVGEFWTAAPDRTGAGGMEIYQLPPFRYADCTDNNGYNDRNDYMTAMII